MVHGRHNCAAVPGTGDPLRPVVPDIRVFYKRTKEVLSSCPNVLGSLIHVAESCFGAVQQSVECRTPSYSSVRVLRKRALRKAR